MIFLIWIRYLAELCMYFGVVLVFQRAFHADVNPLITALVLSLTITLSYIVSICGHERLRFLTLLIPGIFLYISYSSPGGLLTMIPATVYTLAVVIKGVRKIDYYEYLSVYKKVVWGAGILFVVMRISEAAFERMPRLAGRINAAPVVEYGFIYAALGIILLKVLRLGDALERLGVMILLRELLVPLGIIAVLALAFWGEASVREYLSGGFRILLSPLVMLIGALSGGNDKGYLSEQTEVITPTPTEHEGGTLTTLMPTTAPVQTLETAQERSWLIPVIIIILLTCVMIALVFSVRTLKSNPNVQAYTVETMDDDRNRKRRQVRRSNAEKIRGLYSGYLKKTASKGLKITGNMTSAEINAGAAGFTDDVKAAEGLRLLYLSARYDDNAKPGEEDVRRAGEMAKRIYK